jgi:hypothetical protein
VLIDKSGKTFRQFQIRAFPTSILIDPERRLVRRAELDTLQAALKGTLGGPGPESRPGDGSAR